MKTTVEDLLKTYGLIIVFADDQNNYYKVIFDDETRIKMCKAVDFDLSLYEINIIDTFDISIQKTVNGCGEVILVPRLVDGRCLGVLKDEQDESCKTKVY